MLQHEYITKEIMIACSVHPCYVGLCRHGTVYLQVVDGHDGLQLWRVTADILNKQSQTAN